MDRYEADWPMVERGWNCHVLGEGTRYDSAAQAVQTQYDADESLRSMAKTLCNWGYAGMQDDDAVIHQLVVTVPSRFHALTTTNFHISIDDSQRVLRVASTMPA